MKQMFFDPAKRAHFRQRACKRHKAAHAEESGFLHQEAADIIAERLQVTNREFKTGAILFESPYSSLVLQTVANSRPELKGRLQAVSFPRTIESRSAHSEILGLEPESLDLAVSIFDLHWMNDLPGMLLQINRSLKPDGLLMAVLPGEGTLAELNECLVEAEMNFRGGATLRVDAFPQIRQMGDLLRRADFRLPVADSEQRTIHYRNPEKLVEDLRNCGAQCSRPEERLPLTAKIWQQAVSLYREKHSSEDGKLKVSANMVFLSGWKNHESQQKPLKPGSAKENLKDFL